MSDAEELPDRMQTAQAYDENRRTQPAVPKDEATMAARKAAALKALQEESTKDPNEAPPQRPAAKPAPAAAAEPEPAPKAAASAPKAKAASSGEGEDNNQMILIGVVAAVIVLVLLILVLA